MPQPLPDRIRAALAPRSRLKDCQDVLSEVEKALATAQSALTGAEERQLDPTVAVKEAREARLDAEESRLDVIRMERAAERLKARIEEVEHHDAHTAKRERYEAAKAERDRLAAVWRAEVPQMVERFIAIFAETQSNEAEIAAVGASAELLSAEAVARGAPGNFRGNIGLISRFTDMKIPSFDPCEPFPAWPVDRHRLALFQNQQREAAQRVEKRRRELKEEERWTWYALSCFGAEQRSVQTRGGKQAVSAELVYAQMDEAMLEAARGRGVTATRVAIVKLTAPLHRGTKVKTIDGEKGLGPSPIIAPMTADQIMHARAYADIEILVEADAEPEEIPAAEHDKCVA